MRTVCKRVALLSVLAIGSICVAAAVAADPTVLVVPTGGPADRSVMATTQPQSQPDVKTLTQVATTPVAGRPGPATRPASQPAAASQPARVDTTAKLPMPDRAYARLKLGWYDEAEKDLNGLLKSDSADVKLPAAVALSELYRRTGRYEESAKLLDQVAELGKTSPDWQCEKSELVGTLGKYEEALALAQAVLAKDAGNLHARWLAGQLLEVLGRSDEANKLYKAVDESAGKDPPKDAPGRTYAGQMLQRYAWLNRQQVAYGTRVMKDFYQEACTVIDRQYWPARLAAADLSLVAYKVDDARADYDAALRINPKAYEAYLGAIQSMMEDMAFDKMEQLLDRAKKINAKDPAVQAAEAAIYLCERKYDEAAASAEAGLKVNPRHIELMALLAAAKSRLGDRAKVEELTRAAEAVNPRPAGFYATLAQWEAAARQYEVAEALFKKAIELAPWDPNSMTSLGMMYMQTGQEKQANQMLDQSFAIDKFNKRSLEVLKLLDKLATFDTMSSEHFIIRYAKSTEPVIGPYFRDYMEAVYAEITRNYNTPLERRVIIEVFPKHEDFSLRVSGRSWIPTVGASTGWVVALYSPHDYVNQKNAQGDPMGYNWATVLKHEFTHVVTLAATGNRIPHWFTEGLAVHEELAGVPKWRWIDMLSQALRADKLFPVNKIDWGFIRPKAPSDRELAYAQSEWIVQYIIDQHGYKKINEFLTAFHDHKRQPQAIQDVFGMTEAEFDKAFAAWARQYVVTEWRLPAERIAPVPEALKFATSHPDDAAAQAKLAVSYLAAKNAKSAEAAARQALTLDPNQPVALETLGQLLAKDHWADAKEFLVKLADADEKNATAPRMLAQRALVEEQWETAAFWFTRLKAAQPFDPVSYDGLAAIYLRDHNDEKAAPELIELARREEHNPVYALQLARIFSAQGKYADAAKWLVEAMHFNPFEPKTHDRLARAYQAMGKPDLAIGELMMAIQLAPTDETYWARLAFAYKAQNLTDKMTKAAEVAVRLRPESPARELLGLAPASTQPETGLTGEKPKPASQPDNRDVFFQ